MGTHFEVFAWEVGESGQKQDEKTIVQDAVSSTSVIEEEIPSSEAFPRPQTHDLVRKGSNKSQAGAQSSHIDVGSHQGKRERVSLRVTPTNKVSIKYRQVLQEVEQDKEAVNSSLKPAQNIQNDKDQSNKEIAF